MTNRLLAPAPYARFQTSGGSYRADQKGVIAAAAIGDVIDLIRGGCTLLPDDNDFTTTADPTELSDQTQGFSVGSRWFNTAAGRAWVCLSTATGAAIWITGRRRARNGRRAFEHACLFRRGSRHSACRRQSRSPTRQSARRQ